MKDVTVYSPLKDYEDSCSFMAPLDRDQDCHIFIFLSPWGAVSDLVVDGLDFVEQRLGADGLDVVLFEVDALVVQRLQVVLLVLLAPDLVKVPLGLPPLLLLGL